MSACAHPRPTQQADSSLPTASDIVVLRRQLNPHNKVKRVLSAVALLFQTSEDWDLPEVGPRRLLQPESRLHERIKAFDKDSVDPSVIAALKARYITASSHDGDAEEDVGEFSPESVRRASPAAAGLCRWVLSVVKHHDERSSSSAASAVRPSSSTAAAQREKEAVDRATARLAAFQPKKTGEAAMVSIAEVTSRRESSVPTLNETSRFNHSAVLLPLHLSALLSLRPGETNIAVVVQSDPSAPSDDCSAEGQRREEEPSSPMVRLPFVLPAFLWGLMGMLRRCRGCFDTHRKAQYAPRREDITAFRNKDALVPLCEECRMGSGVKGYDELKGTFGFDAIQRQLLLMRHFNGFWGSVICGGEFLPALASTKSVARSTECLIRDKRATAFTTDCLNAVAKGCVNLKSLILQRCDLLDGSAIAAVATHCRQLRLLHLQSIGRLEDDCLHALAHSATALESVTILRCHRITGQGLEALLLGLPNLTKFHVVGCDDVMSASFLLGPLTLKPGEEGRCPRYLASVYFAPGHGVVRHTGPYPKDNDVGTAKALAGFRWDDPTQSTQ